MKSKSAPSQKAVLIIGIIVLAIVIFGIRTSLPQQQPKNSTNEIALGKPCDVNGHEVTDSRGLQCVAYTDLSGQAIKDGLWTYPDSQTSKTAQAIWLYPQEMSKPLFLAQPPHTVLSLGDLTSAWKTYKNTTGHFSFKYPSVWKISPDQMTANAWVIDEFDGSPQGVGDGIPPEITIAYHHYPFEDSDAFHAVKEAPDAWFIPDATDNTFIYTKSFDLNGTPALLVQRMSNTRLQGSEQSSVSVYVIHPDSYVEISYTKYDQSAYDLPVETLITTFKF